MKLFFDPGQSASIGIIGGAGGPTAVYVTSKAIPWATIGLVAAGAAVILGTILAIVCVARKR